MDKKLPTLGAAAVTAIVGSNALAAESGLRITKKNPAEIEHRFEKWNFPAISIFDIEFSKPCAGAEPELDGTKYLNPSDPEPGSGECFLFMLGHPKL